MSASSVISRCTTCGSTPVRSITSCTIETSPTSASWRGERFTNNGSGCPVSGSTSSLAGDPARLGQDPPPHVDDQPGLLGHAEELSRQQKPTRRMVPAHERLHTPNATGRQIDDRLELEHQLLALDRVAQRLFDVEPLDDLGAHTGVEDLHTITAARLGFVHRRVGIAQQLLGRLATRSKRDADAHGHEDLLVADREPTTDLAADTVRELGRLGRTVDTGAEDDELVPTEARDAVVGSRAHPSRRRDMATSS